MSVIRISFVIVYTLCSFGIYGQESNSLADELSKIEYLFRSGELKLADELASRILLDQPKDANIEQFYKILCVTYKVKRGLEESTGRPIVYNFLNEGFNDFRKEKGLIITYFKIRSLREYYLDCLNETDSWIENKDEAFKGRVLSLIEQISEKAIKKKVYDRYPIKNYSGVFSTKEETFKLNSFICDKVYEEITSFYLDALLVEFKEKPLTLTIAENGFDIILLRANTNTVEVRLIDGLNNTMNRRKRLLSITDRAELFALYNLRVVLSLASHSSFKGLDTFFDRIILGAEQELADYFTLDYVSWISDMGKSSKVFTVEKILQWCNRVIENYPRTHLIHNNSLILKYQLEEKKLELKGSKVLHPYQSQGLEISLRNIDTLHYVLCKNPFGYEEEFRNLVQRNQKEALKKLVVANQILKDYIPIDSYEVGVENIFELEILGQPSGAYCLFAGTQEDIFKGEYTLYEYEVARSAVLKYFDRKGQVLEYEYHTNDFSAISESSTNNASSGINKTDTIIFFEKPAVMLNKLDTVKLNAYLLSYSDQSGLDLVANYPFSIQSNESILIRTQGETDDYGQFETVLYSDTGRFYPFEFNITDRVKYSNSMIFNNWVDHELPNEFVEVPYKKRSDGIQLNAYAFGSSDTLSCTLEFDEVMPAQLMLFLDGSMLSVLSPNDLKDWSLPLANRVGYGVHMLELFYISESVPKYYYVSFLVQEEQEDLVEFTENKEPELGRTFSGKLSGAKNCFMLVSGKPKSVDSDRDCSGKLFSTKGAGVNIQETYDSLFSKSFGFQFTGIDPSKYLRKKFPVVNRFKEYDSGVFDYKINSKGNFIGAIIESNTDSKINDSNDGVEQWGYNSLKIYPTGKNATMERGIFAVVFVDTSGNFILDIPEYAKGVWEFNMLYKDEEGLLKGEKCCLRLKN